MVWPEVASAPWKTLVVVSDVFGFLFRPASFDIHYGVPLALMLRSYYFSSISVESLPAVIGNIAGQVLGWQDSFHPFWLLTGASWLSF